MYSHLEKCGWAQAMSESNASYKQEIKIEKPGPSSTHSPNPAAPVEEKEISDGAADVFDWVRNFPPKKLKLSTD